MVQGPDCVVDEIKSHTRGSPFCYLRHSVVKYCKSISKGKEKTILSLNRGLFKQLEKHNVPKPLTLLENQFLKKRRQKKTKKT